MKILHSWLVELSPDLGKIPLEDLQRQLLLLGFEVESLERLGPAFAGVVVGQVLDAQKHPNADRLKLCRVTDGSQEYAVVCGAPNVAAGQRVAFARVGATLPGGTTIARAKIRGTESQGMICSASELGRGNGKSEGILVLGPELALGTDYAAALGGADAVLDVNVTPNRPDCLSHLGLARELAIHLRLPEPLPTPTGASVPGGSQTAPAIALQDGDCPRYIGRVIEGLAVGPSPDWLRRRLEALGMRSVSNVVDVANHVLLELGQPLHLFDLDRLEGGRVEARSARPGERLTALDGRDYELSAENLVIADAARPVAVAGVIGGADSAVSQKTTRAFLEAAHFSGSRIRRSARRLGLRTDASTRYERGTDPSGLEAAAERAATLLASLCPAAKAGAVRAEGKPSAPRPVIRVTTERINSILGAGFPAADVRRVLTALGGVRETAAGLELQPAPHRGDLELPEDLAEEVARHLGYDRIPDSPAAVRLPEPEPPLEAAAAERARDVLRGLGFIETCTYDFASAAELRRYFGEGCALDAYPRVHNPLSADWEFLRPTLMTGLLRSAETNLNRGAEGLRLFEVGKTFLSRADGKVGEELWVAGLLAGPWPARPTWRGPRPAPDLFDAVSAAEALCRPAFARQAAAQNARFHPKAFLELFIGADSVGHAGLLHPELLRRWGLRVDRAAAFEIRLSRVGTPKPPPFSPYSPFPSVRRDLSFTLPEEAAYGAVAAAVRKAAGPLLTGLDLADLFSGAGIPSGRQSMTVRLTLSRMDGTLSEAEIGLAVERVVSALKDLGAELRG